MTYLITTSDPHRRQLWRHLFGRDTLPVLTSRPRWQWLTGRQVETLAYDLDMKALPEGAVARLAAYVARRADWPYSYAKTAVQSGWTISAAGCRLLLEEETSVRIAKAPLPASALPVLGLERQSIAYSS